MKFSLLIKPQAEVPTEAGDYLLYNQCDGFHIVEAHFFEDGSFDGFYSFMGEEFKDDSYMAWAKLPDTDLMYQVFADKPGDGMSARYATLARLRAQQEA